MGSLIAPPNVSTSTEKVSTIHYHPNGRYVGILRNNAKNVLVYHVRSAQDSLRKRQRRLRRRREKKGKVDEKLKGKKRGILDDPESSDEENLAGTRDDMDQSMDPENVKASDEFEYYGSARTSHKIRGFTFVPYKERSRGIRIMCSLSTNALEMVSLVKNTDS
jgi:U3 small nucleolar RNA-associated protein 12